MADSTRAASRGRGRGRGGGRGGGRASPSTTTFPSSTPSPQHMGSGSGSASASTSVGDAIPSPSPVPLPDTREILKPGDVHLDFNITNGIAHRIGEIFRSDLQGPYPTWGKVPKTVKDEWFGLFKESYTWDPAHENQIRKIFNHKGQKLFKNQMNKVRDGLCSTEWIAPDILVQLQEYWDDPEWQKKSEQAKSNRAVESGAASYAGGSVSSAELRKRFKEKEHREPTGFEMMEKTKKLKDGRWVCKKAEDVSTKINILRDERHGSIGEETISVVVDNALYLEVVGGKSKKGTVWGQGELGPLLFSQIESTSQAASQEDSIDVVELQTKVAALSTELGENRGVMESYMQMNDQRFQQVLAERDEARAERDEAQAVARSLAESMRIATTAAAAAERAAERAIAATTSLTPPPHVTHPPHPQPSLVPACEGHPHHPPVLGHDTYLS